MEFLSIFSSIVFPLMLLVIISKILKKSEIDEKRTNKDILYNIGLLITLCVSVQSFLYIIFSFIDKLIPDSSSFMYQNYQIGMPSDVAMMIATLIVVFPLYLLFSYLIEKDLQKDPIKKDLTLRKSVIYLALIITILTIVSLAVATLYTFLLGSLLKTFLLKSLVTLIASILLFAYYYYTLNRDYLSSTNIPKILSLIATILVLATVIFSIVTFGTPNKVRDLNMDSQKISSLTNLSGSILNFYIQNKVLPTSVSEVGYGYKDTLGLNYEYKIISEKEYSLCESFLTEVNYGNDYYLSKWNHPKGYYCFQLNAEKQQY